MPDGGRLVRDHEVDIGLKRVPVGILIVDIRNRLEIRPDRPLLVRITHGVLEEVEDRVALDDCNDSRIELPDRSGPTCREGRSREYDALLRRLYAHEELLDDVK